MSVGSEGMGFGHAHPLQYKSNGHDLAVIFLMTTPLIILNQDS